MHFVLTEGLVLAVLTVVFVVDSVYWGEGSGRWAVGYGRWAVGGPLGDVGKG